MSKLNKGVMDHRLTIRVDDQLLLLLKDRARSENMQVTAYIRYLLNKYILEEDQNVQPELSDQIQRLMIKSSIQTLSLVRNFISKSDQNAISLAVKESEDVISHLYGDDDEFE